jgi:hypothetical protein
VRIRPGCPEREVRAELFLAHQHPLHLTILLA